MANYRNWRTAVRGQLPAWQEKNPNYTVYERPRGDPGRVRNYIVDELICNITQTWNFPQYISIIGYSYSIGTPKRQPGQRVKTVDPEHDLYQTNFSLMWRSIYHPSTNVVRHPSGRYSYQGLRGTKGNALHMITGYIEGFDAVQMYNMEEEIVEAYENNNRHVWLRSLWKLEALRAADDWKYQNRYLANHLKGIRLAGN